MASIDEQLIVDTPESTQLRAFAPAELVSCPACSRTNAPTRANCLYCGAGLGNGPATPSTPLTPATRETEPSEVVHVVALSTQQSSQPAPNAELAALLNLTTSEFNVLLGRHVAPLYTAREADQAKAISEQLTKAGIATVTISEEQLKPATPPKEISALKLDADSLIASFRRSSEKVSIAWDDVSLIVLGRLYFMTSEIEQKRNNSKQVIDERQSMRDEAVLDFYVRDDEIGWRIRAASFDFSCLGSEKRVTAFENFAALTALVRTRGEKATFDDGYVRMRIVLNKIWPVEARSSSTQRRRRAIRDIRATATVSDNELQFTRYSRLLRAFHTSELPDDARQS